MDRRDFNMDVNPIHEGTGNFRHISLNSGRRTSTMACGISEKAARTGVERGNQHETTGVIQLLEKIKPGNPRFLKAVLHICEGSGPEILNLLGIYMNKYMNNKHGLLLSAVIPDGGEAWNRGYPF